MINCRQPSFRRQVHDPFSSRSDQGVLRHRERTAARPDRVSERTLELVRAAYFHRMKLQAQSSRGVDSLSIVAQSPEFLRSHSTATRESLGMVSLSSSSRLPPSTPEIVVNP